MWLPTREPCAPYELLTALRLGSQSNRESAPAGFGTVVGSRLQCVISFWKLGGYI